MTIVALFAHGHLSDIKALKTLDNLKIIVTNKKGEKIIGPAADYWSVASVAFICPVNYGVLKHL